MIDLGDIFEADAFFHFFHQSVILLYFLAGAEVLNEGIHEQDGAIGDDDKDGGKGTGQAIAALFGELVDLHGDEQELRRDQQNDGGNGGNAAHERGDQTAEEGILDEGESDGGEHLAAARTQIIGGFLDALIDLP